MNDSTVWSVDRIAARNLLVNLQLELSEGDAELIAQHFAHHRRSACTWAAERVHGNIVDRLATASRDLFERKCEAWVDGFGNAERMVLAMPRDELVGIDTGKGRTKGQLLRTLVRQARARLADH